MRSESILENVSCSASRLGNVPTYRLKPVRRFDKDTQREVAIKTSAATAQAKAAYKRYYMPVLSLDARNTANRLTAILGNLANESTEKLSS